MNLANKLRLAVNKRPKVPAGTTYVLDTKEPGIESAHVVRMLLPGHANDDRGEQVGPSFTMFDKAAEYREWLSGERDSFSYGPGPV